LNFEELPKNIQQKYLKHQRKFFFVNHLWLLENNFDFISETKICFKINVFFENKDIFFDNQQGYFVQKILYEKSGS